jgi:hypothetical protein
MADTNEVDLSGAYTTDAATDKTSKASVPQSPAVSQPSASGGVDLSGHYGTEAKPLPAANVAGGAGGEWETKEDPSFLERVGNAAGKVGDIASSAFKGLTSLAPSMGGSHIAQAAMGKSGAYNPEQGEAAAAVRQKMASTGSDIGAAGAEGMWWFPYCSTCERTTFPRIYRGGSFHR